MTPTNTPSNTPSSTTRCHRRAVRSFWLLVAASVVATGGLTSALAAPASPFTGIRVAVSGLILVLSVGLAIRVMAALDRARRSARESGT